MRFCMHNAVYYIYNMLIININSLKIRLHLKGISYLCSKNK